MRIATARRIGGVVLSILLVACGGSGGGGGGAAVPSAADLVDTYFTVQFSGTDDATTEGFTGTGTFTADGAGGASRTYVANDLGAISGPFFQPFTYTVGADGSLALSAGLLVSARGGLTADGSAALLGMVAPNLNPGVMTLFRRSGIYSPASLTGLYHMVLFTVFPSDGSTATFTGPVTFDGAGGAAFTGVDRNVMGAHTPVTASFTYTVAGDGASTETFGGGPCTGGLVAGGALGIWGGSPTTTENPLLLVVVRAATSASLATFQGEYWMVRLSRSPVIGGYVSNAGLASADGMGAVAFQLTSNSEGTASTGSGGAAYTVAADGTLALALAQPQLGGITQDGRFAILGGASGASANPTITLFVRR